MMALVVAGTLNSSAAYFSTAVNGASSGTLSLRGEGSMCRGKFHINFVNTTLHLQICYLINKGS